MKMRTLRFPMLVLSRIDLAYFMGGAFIAGLMLGLVLGSKLTT